jgi:RNA polymerase sigma-70 factor (ECF subfamily)
MTGPTEIELRERWTQLWLEAEPAVRAFIFTSISSFEDAEDVVQKVAMEAARRFREYDATRSFQAWVLWLAKSRVIDFYRVKGREHVVFSEPLLDRLADNLASRVPRSPSARAAALEHCIEKLPDKSHQLLTLRYENGASAQEIAEALKSSAASVRVMLHRVRNLLADCIELELRKEGRC